MFLGRETNYSILEDFLIEANFFKCPNFDKIVLLAIFLNLFHTSCLFNQTK